METSKFGFTPKIVIKWLAASDKDKQVRDWLAAECEKLGCTAEVDVIGNWVATRRGKRKDVLPIAIRSHLRTQPTGDKFDGVLINREIWILGVLRVLASGIGSPNILANIGGLEPINRSQLIVKLTLPNLRDDCIYVLVA